MMKSEGSWRPRADDQIEQRDRREMRGCRNLEPNECQKRTKYEAFLCRECREAMMAVSGGELVGVQSWRWEEI